MSTGDAPREGLRRTSGRSRSMSCRPIEVMRTSMRCEWRSVALENGCTVRLRTHCTSGAVATISGAHPRPYAAPRLSGPSPPNVRNNNSPNNCFQLLETTLSPLPPLLSVSSVTTVSSTLYDVQLSYPVMCSSAIRSCGRGRILTIIGSFL